MKIWKTEYLNIICTYLENHCLQSRVSMFLLLNKPSCFRNKPWRRKHGIPNTQRQKNVLRLGCSFTACWNCSDAGSCLKRWSCCSSTTNHASYLTSGVNSSNYMVCNDLSQTFLCVNARQFNVSLGLFQKWRRKGMVS